MKGIGKPRGRWQRFIAKPYSGLGSLQYLGCAAGNKQLSRPIDKSRHRMDALAPHSDELLQNRQPGVGQKRGVGRPDPFAINKQLILTQQINARAGHYPLDVPEAMNMRARLYKDRIG